MLVIDADRALVELLTEWLSALGCDIVTPSMSGIASADRFDLILVDVPYPRRGATEHLSQIAVDYPATPVVALSANFFPSVEQSGSAAQLLGVAAVLPMPVARDALLHVVNQVLRPEP